MQHNHIGNDNSGDHWGVSFNSNGQVIVQLQENGEQVRLAMTTEQASHMIEKLKKAIEQTPLNNLNKMYKIFF